MNDAHKSVFGTGFQETTVSALADGGFQFTRLPGINNTEGFPTAPAGLGPWLAQLRTGPVAFRAPVLSTDQRTVWQTVGDVSFATLARAEPESELVRGGVEQLASALRAFHTTPPAEPLDVPAGPPSLQRFQDWLQTGDGTRASRPWRVHLRSALGSQRWDKLRAAAHALSPSASTTNRTVHGWMSLGSVILGDSGPGTVRTLDVLTGTDLGQGPPELDIAWVLGELAEFAHRAVHFGFDATPYEHLETLYSVTYGDGVDDDLIRTGKAVRVAIHSCDFANFVGWHEDLDVYPQIIADVLDQAAG